MVIIAHWRAGKQVEWKEGKGGVEEWEGWRGGRGTAVPMVALLEKQSFPQKLCFCQNVRFFLKRVPIVELCHIKIANCACRLNFCVV